MPTWPLWGHGGGNEQGGVTPTTGALVSLPGDATAHVKGAWTEVLAATARPTEGVVVHVHDTAGASGSRYLVDLALGAAASEKVVLANLPLDVSNLTNSSAGGLWGLTLPLVLPAGVRLAMRCQAGVAGEGCFGAVHLLGGGPRQPSGFGRISTYGADTTTTKGTTVTGGNAAKGSWAELAASTTDPIRLLWLYCGNDAQTARAANRTFSVDLGVGAAASEKVLIGDLPVRAFGSEWVVPPWLGPFAVDLPAGVRLSVRAACSGSTANTIDCVLLGAG